MSALKKIYIINKLPPFDPLHFTSPDINSYTILLRSRRSDITRTCTQERAINYNYNQIYMYKTSLVKEPQK